MSHYLLSEIRLAIHPALWLLPCLIAILRLTGVIWQPDEEGWLVFLEVVFPLLFPLLSFSLLEREKNWHTLEVMITAPRRKAAILLIRYLVILFLLFLTAVAAVRPRNYLLLFAPGLLLGSTTLIVGILRDEEVGLGMGLFWWGFSLLASMQGLELYRHPILKLFILLLLPSPLSSHELLIWKCAHLAAGSFLLFAALAVAEWKRSWKLS